ncbi:SRPBCC domain-containing protein [Marinobacter sp. JSM 1782161]|uniref:SRPBCC domain-containing protein n=1 Tax=Marinobacter sp. JSM 1782161 TaxID=2685906 RepID=UPI001403D0A4|nr:SRPBCC domain-containing protein [Marinobacter sp. JSM 1782161]
MTDDRTLHTSRILPFSPEEIYGAFASPELLAAWWGPEGFSNTFEIHDFREGGRWKFIMHAPDGTEHQNESKFEVLEPNSKIVIHHDCPPNFWLTVELTVEADGTQITWNQMFEDARTAQVVKERAGPANEQNLDRLTRVLEQERNAV